MSRQALKCTVEGHVQGVFYRVRTLERATELGIDGWVRNLNNGCVELVVCGDDDAVERLIAWLWKGPPNAQVSAVAVEDWQGNIDAGFQIVD